MALGHIYPGYLSFILECEIRTKSKLSKYLLTGRSSSTLIVTFALSKFAKRRGTCSEVGF